MEELTRVGVPEGKIHRVGALKRDPGALGCTLSHIKAFQMILDAGWQRVLILEDDFTWMPGEEEGLAEKIGELMKCRKPWDVVQIAWNPSGRVIGDGPLSWLRRGVGVRNAAGYFVSLGFVEALLENFKEAAVDMYKNGFSSDSCCDMNWQKLQYDANWYVAFPPLGYQMDGWSDIEGRVVSYGC
jgi:hypothetical protein